MSTRKACAVFVQMLAPFAIAYCTVSGCQSGPPLDQCLYLKQTQVSRKGLEGPEAVQPLKAMVSLPMGWTPASPDKGKLYTHQQWWSPSHRTSIGVTYIRMPLPLGTSTILRLATCEAEKKFGESRVLKQWKDAFGREWFEAERDACLVTGYVMIRGLDAWINYFGYRNSSSTIITWK